MSQAINDMFTGIAQRYDAANTVLSFGIHHLWRAKVVKLSGVSEGENVLDCATGTGDLAIKFKRRVGARGRVTGTDFNSKMIELAAQKASSRSIDITFSVADVMSLPFTNNTFNCSSIAFGIRNVDDPLKGLREMARVTKPGGRVVVLEFGQPRGLFGSLYRMYSKYIMPLIGGTITGNRSAYEYLPETASKFKSGSAFAELMMSTNSFESVELHRLTNAVAWIYVGVVI